MFNTTTQPCPPTSPLDDPSRLSPLELLSSQIELLLASFLTVKDACSHVVVSRHLQDVAESVIYQDLNLCPEPKYVDDMGITKSFESRKHDRLLEIVSATLARLLSRPTRFRLARTLVLRLPVGNSLTQEQSDIIASTRHNLTTMRVLQSLSYRPILFPLCHQVTKPFPQLVVLDYVQPSSMTARCAFDAAFALAPNLRRLTISILRQALWIRKDSRLTRGAVPAHKRKAPLERARAVATSTYVGMGEA